MVLHGLVLNKLQNAGQKPRALNTVCECKEQADDTDTMCMHCMCLVHSRYANADTVTCPIKTEAHPYIRTYVHA